MTTGTTRATPVLLWTRAALLSVVVVAASVIGHVSADGLLPGPLALLALLGATAVVSARFLTRQASAPRLVALLVGGQAVVHGLLSLLAGHGSSSASSAWSAAASGTGAASAPAHGFVFDGRQTERTGSYFDQVDAMQTGATAATGAGTDGTAAVDAGLGVPLDAGLAASSGHHSGLAHLVEHLATQGLGMMLAHLGVVALLGFWLAVGERALWTVLTLTTTRLLALVACAGSAFLGRWVTVLLEHVRRAPYLATTGRCVVPLPHLLHHVVAHRGPPALLAA